MTLWEELVIVLVVLKVPCFYVGWVMWWAIKAEPELGTEGGTDSINWRPWRPPSTSSSSHARRFARGASGRGRDRIAVRAARRQARMSEERQ